MGNYLVTRLIWQHMGGEGGDRRPRRKLVVPCGFEGESLVGLLGWKRTSGRWNKAGLVRSDAERSLNDSGENWCQLQKRPLGGGGVHCE